MKILQLLLATILLINVAFSQDKTGLLLIGEIQKLESGSSQFIDWTSTRITASISDEKMIIKTTAELIPTPMGGIEEINLFVNGESKYAGGGSRMDNKDGRLPGICGVNMMISHKKNGYYQGDGYMFYPTSGHNIHVILIFDGDK
jgi:hypothetical protein